jgi:hypothetical protein
MLLKERARCRLGINLGTTDWKECLDIQDSLIKELVDSLTVPNDPLKEIRLRNMWKDMENFVNNGIAAKMKSKPTFDINAGEPPKVANKIEKNQKSMSINKTYASSTNASYVSVIKPEILKPVKGLPQYLINSQEKLAKLEKKLN